MASPVLKVFHGDDVRRIRMDMPYDNLQCFEAVQKEVIKAFSLETSSAAPVSVALMCKDEDVLCELTPNTLRKLLDSCDDSCLRLYICETGLCDPGAPTEEAVVEESQSADGASPQGDVSGKVHQGASLEGSADGEVVNGESASAENASQQGNAPDEVHPAASAETSAANPDGDAVVEECEGVEDSPLQGYATHELQQEASPPSSRPSFIRLGSFPMPDMGKKPDHVGEGLLQGLHHMGQHVSSGIDQLRNKSRSGHEQEGAVGAMKGTGEGLLNVAHGVWKGWYDLKASTYEGLRRTPDTVADHVNSDRHHNKHGVQGEGRGDLLETNLEGDEEPQHALHGLVRGVTGVGRGVSGGLKAMVERPREAYRENGVEGLPKGLGQGVLGLGTNVASGALDFCISMNLGWKNTPEAIARAFNERNSSGNTSSQATAVTSPSTPVDVAAAEQE